MNLIRTMTEFVYTSLNFFNAEQMLFYNYKAKGGNIPI